MSDIRKFRYTKVAIWLHWLIAFFIIVNLGIGLLLDDLAKPIRFYFMTVHVSAGLSVLALSVLRILWRVIHTPPAYPKDMPLWEKRSANIAHFLLYAGMVLVPLTGWMMGSANPPAGSEGLRYVKYVAMAKQQANPETAENLVITPADVPDDFTLPEVRWLKLWFVLPLPNIELLSQLGAKPEGLESQKVLHDAFELWHEVGSYLLIALLIMHVLAALKHQFVDRQKEFERMWYRRIKD